GGPGQARRHQRARLRRLRRLLGAEQLPVGRAGRDRVRPQAPDQPEHLQQGLLLREGLLPELRDGRRRAEGGKMKGASKNKSAARGRPNPSPWAPIPEPALPLAETPWGIVVAGVG